MNGAAQAPLLLTRKIEEFGLVHYALPAGVFYPVHHILTRALFKADSRGGLMASLVEGAHCVHFWNEVVRRMGLDKNATYPATSIHEQLKARYGIPA